jgi:hypothetical protein
MNKIIQKLKQKWDNSNGHNININTSICIKCGKKVRFIKSIDTYTSKEKK